MDPITALGVAGSIVQLVDFGIKVVSKGNKIYYSGDGSTAENHDLENVANDLVLIQNRLRQSLYPLGVYGPLSEDEQALGDLGAISSQVAEALLEQLNKAKAQGRFRRWKSLRQAVKSVSSKSQVEDLARRLVMLRDQFNLRILVRLKNDFDIRSFEQSKEYNRLHQTSKDVLEALKDNRDLFAQGLVSNATFLSQRLDRTDDLVLQAGKTIVASVERLAEIWDRPAKSRKARVQQFYLDSCHVMAEDAVLRSLLYPMIQQRHETIVEAHANTFRWIFKNPTSYNKPWDDFTLWLTSQNDTYWISGKAASGKSTLMKYIRTNPELQQYLARWAGDTPFICAYFFFWNLGTTLQKSQAGLFRALLYQILSERRDLIPAILPELWKRLSRRKRDFLHSLQEAWHSWSLLELQQVLEPLFKQTASSLKFCFFIDGLDEFDGDHLEIISLLRNISLNSNVKMCVSSRPLLAFEHAFEQCPKLCLQDLTVDDIRLYIHDKLNEHQEMSKLQHNEPESTEALITEIVEMSSGVFLWVTLVTRSLLKGLTNLDGISDLQKRLRELPPELDNLFSLMLKSITPTFYLEQASRIFQIVYHAAMPLSTLQLSFANDEDDSLALRPGKATISPSDRHARHVSIVARLKSRCAGLVEVQNADKSVQFLHLTVKEFLEKPEVWSMILRWTASTSFNAHISLLRAGILDLKDHYTMSQRSIETVLEYASLAEDGTGQAQHALVDELARTCENIGVCDFYVGTCHEQYCIHASKSLLLLMMRKGLVLYVKSQLGHTVNDVNRRLCKPLLEHVTLQQGTCNELHLAMIDFLLQEGLNPNETSHDSTPWRRLLLQLECMGSAGTYGLPWVDVCKLFLSYGANPEEQFITDSEALVGTPALEIVRKAFAHLPAESVAELEAMFLGRNTTRPLDKQMGRKRNAGDDGENLPSAKKRALGSERHVDTSIFPDPPSGRHARMTQKGPSWELLEEPVTNWSEQEGRANGTVVRYTTIRQHRSQPHHSRNPDFYYEMCRGEQDFAREAYYRERSPITSKIYEEHPDEWRAGIPPSERYGSFYSSPDRRPDFNYNYRLYRGYGRPSHQQGDFEHRHRAYNSYHDYYTQDFGYQSTSTCYLEYEGYSRSVDYPRSSSERLISRRRDERAYEDWRFPG